MRAITVLGMHRSGTSAITRALGLLGADMGPRQHLGKYWENRYLRRTNQRLLGETSTWDNPPDRDDGFGSRRGTKSHLSRARRLVKQDFGASPLIVWKDPRTCLTLPFWRRVFDEDPVVVLIHRHPVEIAGSPANRNQLGVGHVFAVWERYNADAIRFSAGLPAVVIDYGRTISDPIGVVGSLVETLASWGIDLPNDPATTDLELRPDNRHHEAPSAGELDHPAATKSQRQLFGRLPELEGGHRKFKPGRVRDPHPLSLEILAMARQRRLWAAQPELATPIEPSVDVEIAAATADGLHRADAVADDDQTLDDQPRGEVDPEGAAPPSADVVPVEEAGDEQRTDALSAVPVSSIDRAGLAPPAKV